MNFVLQVADLRTKRPQRQFGHLERLDAKRNADDGDAQHQSDDGPAGGQEQTAQKQPQNIAKKSHGNMVTNVGRYGQDFAVRSDRS